MVLSRLAAVLFYVLRVRYCLSVLVYAGLSLFIIVGPYLYLVVCVVYAYNLALSDGVSVSDAKNFTKEWVEYPFLAMPANANSIANAQCERTLTVCNVSVKK